MTIGLTYYLLGGRYQYEEGGLRVKAVTEEDNGVYTCRAEVASDGRLKEKQIHVLVHSKSEEINLKVTQHTA